jgi:hypothetical protein
MRSSRLFASVVVILAAMASLLVSTPAQAAGDMDGDGLDDALEDALATRFFPWVWFDEGEDAGCTHPATTSGTPGTVLARVRKHPNDPNKIAIQYVILYRQDCGDLFGIKAHFGDVEPVAVTAAPNPACPHGYGAWGLKTVAHEGVPGQHTDQRFLGNSCNWGRVAGGSQHVSRIYSSENKHGNYAGLDSCDSALAGLEHCSESFTLPYNVFNVGEDHARRIDNLTGYGFPGEYAWTAVPFRGGLGNGNGDAGLIRDKFFHDGLLAIAYEPPPSTECNQPAHAWYQTPSNNQYINQGANLLVIAAGVEPDTVAQFRFFQGGNEVRMYQTRWANDNCVINQEYMQVTMPPGTYQVNVNYWEPSSIGGAVFRVAQLPDLVVQPGSGGGGGGGGGGGDDCLRRCGPLRPIYTV